MHYRKYMSISGQNNRLISHAIAPDAFEATFARIHDRLKKQGDKPYATLAYQLELLEQMSQFDFGRFLLQNSGVNGYWTHYMVMHPRYGRVTGKNNAGQPFNELEDYILNRSPTMLATQQRMEIFLRENQEQVKDNAVLACIPCGMMGELLYLDYSQVKNIKLVGIDYDSGTFEDAKFLAKQKTLDSYVEFQQADAWQLQQRDAFDLISSNGLNIYEPSDDKIAALFNQYYLALKPNGKLVTSFLTFPPTLVENCEWDLTKVNKDDLMKQRILFIDVMSAKFQCYSSSKFIRYQLESVGFKDIEIKYDEARIFPTVIAWKR